MTTVAGPAVETAERPVTNQYSVARARARRRREGAAAARTGIQAAIIVIWCLLPFYWMVVVGFRDSGYTFDPNPLPVHLTLQNWAASFDTAQGNNLALALGNSFGICLIVTVIALVVGISASYALARLTFPGKGFVMGFILGASMFPGVALLTPLFKLEEAARIDGCTPAQAFRIVILPLAAPAVFTTAILAFISSWNEYLLVSVLGNSQIQTVTYAIAQFSGPIPHVQPYTTVMAAGTIVTIPLIILVLVFQRRIVAGLTAGGVKG
jgi:multiple sugar transport system permease protein